MDQLALYELFKQYPLVSTDTRKIAPNCLYFALKGETFDGNAFASDALEKGAAYAIIDNPAYKVNDRYIVVDDVLKVLQQLAHTHRSNLKIPVIGLTGSNGKTTTKELIYAVLSQTYKTMATRGNLNNHIGVPLTLLEITPDIEIAVIEMGANHPEEIAFLCELAMPTHGLITNIGKAHLEGFGSFEGVKKTKGELYDYLAATDGVLFIQGDNPILAEVSKVRFEEESLKKALTYGFSSKNQISGELIEANPLLAFTWHKSTHPGKSYRVKTKLAGSYNLENLLAAVAIGEFFNIPVDTINEALEKYTPSNSRSQIIDTEKGNRVIGDYYNANASSMTAALENFSQIQDHKPKIMILGDMFEMGDESASEHLHLIQSAMVMNVDRIIFVGKHFFEQRLQIPSIPNASFYQTLTEAKDALRQEPILHSLVLLKGSRGIAMEGLMEDL